MFLSTDEIAACTRWLLENASPPVRYLTHRHILETDPQSESMRALWRAVEQGSDAREIFSRQNEDGTWFSGGPWGPRGYRRGAGPGYTADRPKFVTTAWILPYLGEMGFTADDERVRRACEAILEDHHYRTADPAPRKAAPRKAATGMTNCCGLFAIPLRGLASVGMAADERLRDGWEWLTLCQRPDGGWLNPNHLADSPTPSTTRGRWPWDRSCAWGSFYAAQALYFAEDTPYHQALPAALGFLVRHLGHADPDHIRTWVYHGHNTVKELLMASATGVAMDTAPLKALLDWLKGYYRPDEGMFRTQAQPISNFTRHIAAIQETYEAERGADYWKTVAKASPEDCRQGQSGAPPPPPLPPGRG
ncbi:MAG: hypothetical protein MUF84_13875 [Anaerolineae bacterium]|nr:hypothetical protein [Anaerolineae bacterium]